MKNLGLLVTLILLTWVQFGFNKAALAMEIASEAETTSQQRSEYQEKTQARLRELNNRINALDAKAAKHTQTIGKELDRQIAELDQKRAVTQQKFEKFKTSSEAAWRDMKPGIDAAMKDLEVAYKRAASHFK